MSVAGPKARRSSTVTGKLKVHDPFELVRWLALSQPDPRKAMAELVQNSLDAGARRIVLSRRQLHRQPTLSIVDDGEGVIPDLERREALQYVATHIGHSRKRSLSPKQRLELMTQGQYGIGLLGFWSLGERLEIHSFLPGQQPYRLILHRERPDFAIEPISAHSLFEEPRTEVLVVGLHREAQRLVSGVRAAEYLAAELRGQLLAREVELVVIDRMTRGREAIPVRPPRFVGERLVRRAAPVPGYPPLQVDVYLAPEGDTPRQIAVYAAGTLVADGFRELAAHGLDHAPWTDARLVGLVDFPGLMVVPGSRRGLVPGPTTEAFAAALAEVEPELSAALAAYEERVSAELDRQLLKSLRRAFRDFYRGRHGYALLPVSGGQGGGGGGGESAANGVMVSVGAAGEEPPAESPPADEVASFDPGPAPLFPVGPLAGLEIKPKSIRLAPLANRELRVRALDAHGARYAGRVDYLWRLRGVEGELTEVASDGTSVRLTAGPWPGEGTVSVVGCTADGEAIATATVVVGEPEERGGDEGVPDPELVERPGAPWRSRLEEGRWLVNTAHRDYRAIAESPRMKLRYLALLFAKEVVVRSAQDPRLDEPLEQLVEIASFADRNVARRRGRGTAEDEDEGG